MYTYKNNIILKNILKKTKIKIKTCKKILNQHLMY